MKISKIISAAGLTTVLFAATAVPAFAAGTPNQQSCFGQGRSEYMTTNGGQAGGAILADRAGENAQMNADYRTACQAA